MITLITNSPPLFEIGLKSLKAHLEAAGIDVRAIYLDTRVLTARLADDVVELCQGSALVGMSVMGRDVGIMAALTAKVRGMGIPVVWGGIHATAMPEAALEHADYVCVGDGEEPLRMLYKFVTHKGGPLRSIPNIGFHVGRFEHMEEIDTVHLNPVTYALPSLDAAPMPDYVFCNTWCLHRGKDGVSLARVPFTAHGTGEFFKESGETLLLFYSQRGCPFHCAYCSNSLLHRLSKGTGEPWCRRASVARIISELRHHVAVLPQVTRIIFNDDDLLARPIGELSEIASFMRDEIRLPFDINAIPTKVTDENVAMLVAAGMRNIHIGLQTGSQRVLREVYKRGTTPTQVVEAAYTIKRHANANTLTCYSMILDCPYETVDDWRLSASLVLALPWPRSITHLSLAFFPGTELTERALAEGLIPHAGVHNAKRITLDFRFTYANFVFLLNRYWRVWPWVNDVLLSDWMCKSWMAAPIRAVLAMGAVVPRAWKWYDMVRYYWYPLTFKYRGIKR